jgi:hypothetical protein
VRERTVLLGLVRSCFTRTQTWLQAAKYVSALASDLPSRNGWSVAEHAGDRAPDRSQRLLNRACRDEAAAMSQVRKYAAAGLDAAARRPRRQRMAVGALDETGQEKQGSATAGVKRQYMGCAGRVANGINTVHLSYVREKTGHALAGARQWIPAGDITDPVKFLVTALPLDLQFRTKGQLAIDVLGGAYADGLSFDVACGDEVYGSCTELRRFPEDRGQAYVLRVASSFISPLAPGIPVTCKEAVKKLLKGKRAWEARSAGQGSKGERWYAWAWIGTSSPHRSLPVRRHLKTGELAFRYRCVPEGQLASRTPGPSPGRPRTAPARQKPRKPGSPPTVPAAARRVPPKTRRPAMPRRTAQPGPAAPPRRTAARPAPSPRPAPGQGSAGPATTTPPPTPATRTPPRTNRATRPRPTAAATSRTTATSRARPTPLP